MLTVPLRRSWAQKDGWFRPWVTWDKVRWLVRWHGWLDADFQRDLYQPLLAQIPVTQQGPI